MFSSLNSRERLSTLQFHLERNLMDTLTAIHNRHSIGEVRPDPLPRPLIEKLLAAGAQAPNHYKVRPWRFFVITGSGLNRLGDVLAKSLSLKNVDLPTEALAKERSKPLRAPLIIAVGVDNPNEPKVSEVENICAAAAACQNILLAAQSLGLAAIWRTGPATIDPLVRDFLGLDKDQHLIAFIYIGYPTKPSALPQRPDFSDRTIWLDK
jgi:nitroreductase